MNRQMLTMVTRRQAIVGAASVIITTGISSRASALGSIVPWASQIAVGVASSWLVEAMKSWGLVPGATANTAQAVNNDHRNNVSALRDEGYNVRLMYSGDCAAGDFELSQATLRDDYRAFGTTFHGSTCTVFLDKADTVNLGCVASALRKRGYSARVAEAVGHPIHPSEDYEFLGNERYSPEYDTPAHGTIAWKTNLRNPRPNAITAIRSPIVNRNVHVERQDSGRWIIEMRDPVELQYA